MERLALPNFRVFMQMISHFLCRLMCMRDVQYVCILKISKTSNDILNMIVITMNSFLKSRSINRTIGVCIDRLKIHVPGF